MSNEHDVRFLRAILDDDVYSYDERVNWVKQVLTDVPERGADLNEGVPQSVTLTVNPDGDTDVNPSHYDFPGGVQVIDITKHLDFLTGNVVKYVSRAGRKGDRLTDLLKAEKYLRWAIEKEQSEKHDQ